MSNFFINPDLLKKATESSNPLLNVPEDATAGRGNSYRWSELLTITSVSLQPADKGRIAVEVRYKVSLASPNAVNRGKSTRSRFLLNLTASDGTGDYTMTVISVANIKSLIRAVDPEADLDSGLDLAAYFTEGNSPLINQDLVATITDKPDRDDPSIRRQEITRFISLQS